MFATAAVQVLGIETKPLKDRPGNPFPSGSFILEIYKEYKLGFYVSLSDKPLKNTILNYFCDIPYMCFYYRYNGSDKTAEQKFGTVIKIKGI